MKTFLFFLFAFVFSGLFAQAQITNSNTLNAPATNSIESIPLVEDEKLELKEEFIPKEKIKQFLIHSCQKLLKMLRF
jgi:hypothetical protein